MSQTVKLSTKITSEAKFVADLFNRSLAGQIEYWAKIGKIAEENPDMTYEFIRDILIAKKQMNSGKSEKLDFSI